MHKEILYLPSEAPELADTLLFEFDDIANNLGIFHFLNKGTLLGFIRDGTYPPTDIDVDVGVLCSREELGCLHNALLDNGYTKEKTLLLVNRGFFKNGVELDVQHDFSGNLRQYLEQVETINYKGRTFNIPCPVEDFLATKYGKSWETPKDWEWMNGWHK